MVVDYADNIQQALKNKAKYSKADELQEFLTKKLAKTNTTAAFNYS